MHKLLANAADRGRTGVSWLIRADTYERAAAAADEYLLRLFCDHGTGCGTCLGCQKYMAHVHVDLLIVEGNKVDDVRGLASFASKHSFEGRAKAIYIPKADLLTEQAQNALLKLLEEPPEDTVMVLCAVNADAVLPTILSRCTVVEAPPDSDRAAERVAETAGLALPQAQVLVSAAGGDYAGAVALNENGFLTVRDHAADAVHRILGAKNRATSKIEKLLWDEDKGPELSLRAAVLYLEDILQKKYAGQDARIINVDLEDRASQDAAASARSITAALTGLHRLIERMRACKGLNKRLALQGTLLDILEDIV